MADKFVYPNCGSDNIVLATVTVAHFVTDEDSFMEKPILEKRRFKTKREEK